MKKIFFGLELIVSGHSIAQDVEYNHSGGLTYLVGIYSYSELTENVDYSENSAYGYTGLTYNPRLDFKLDRELSFSVTAYPTLCANLTAGANSRTGTTSSGTLAFEVPVGAQLNFGNHSTSRSRKDFGGFVMAGYNFGAYSGVGAVHSICAQAGMKFYLREQAIGLRFEYNVPLSLEKSEKLQLFGVGLLYNFER